MPLMELLFLHKTLETFPNHVALIHCFQLPWIFNGTIDKKRYIKALETSTTLCVIF